MLFAIRELVSQGFQLGLQAEELGVLPGKVLLNLVHLHKIIVQHLLFRCGLILMCSSKAEHAVPCSSWTWCGCGRPPSAWPPPAVLHSWACYWIEASWPGPPAPWDPALENWSETPKTCVIGLMSINNVNQSQIGQIWMCNLEYTTKVVWFTLMLLYVVPFLVTVYFHYMKHTYCQTSYTDERKSFRSEIIQGE